jgi:hypothetical protein
MECSTASRPDPTLEKRRRIESRPLQQSQVARAFEAAGIAGRSTATYPCAVYGVAQELRGERRGPRTAGDSKAATTIT